MKKKILALLATITVCVTCLTGCNQQIIDLNLKFDKALVKVGEEWVNVEVEKWNDYDGEQLQLILKDGTVMIVCSVNCILYNGDLPKVVK